MRIMALKDVVISDVTDFHRRTHCLSDVKLVSEGGDIEGAFIDVDDKNRLYINSPRRGGLLPKRVYEEKAQMLFKISGVPEEAGA